ncbi:MAG: Nif3-like dinuclear metal center hexameric protein [Oscillospiraceae bacterium]|nr:Nif3-like dinuclear metal center hexameric protein [Oscillospiraceae bacterium]
MTIRDIYNILDAYAPFALQESYDKSGLLAGDPSQQVRRILLTLDITVPVVKEAAEKGADLILSHHPVIWDPLRTVMPPHPVWHLVRHGIGAICSHTCLDIAEGGLNDFAGDLIEKEIPLTDRQPLEALSDGRTLGRTAVLTAPLDADSLAAKLQAVFSCGALRYYAGHHADRIRKIAWCTGSGGDLISAAAEKGADALITGDCKHSVWAEAQNRGFTLFDCGHFETEVPVVHLFEQILHDAAPEIACIISEAGTAPFFSTYKQEGAPQ